MPYAIVRISDGAIVRKFGSLPAAFEVEVDGRNRRIVAPVNIGDEGLGYRFCELVEVDFARPGPYFTQGADTRDQPEGAPFVGNILTITRTWTAWTQAEIDAYEAGRKDNIANEFDQVDNIVRAAILVIMDEINRYSQALTDIKAATANAGSFAQLKTNIAAVNTPAPRTAAQLKTAIRAKLDAA